MEERGREPLTLDTCPGPGPLPELHRDDGQDEGRQAEGGEGYPFLAPMAQNTPTTASPAAVGAAKFLLRFRLVARRQAMTGPIPVRANSTSPMGIFTRLKNGWRSSKGRVVDTAPGQDPRY